MHGIMESWMENMMKERRNRDRDRDRGYEKGSLRRVGCELKFHSPFS